MVRAEPRVSEPVPPIAWRMLALGVASQTAAAIVVSTPAYLIPLLHLQRGLSLSEAGLIAAVPNFGTVLTVVLWGALADRYGERWVIGGGLALTAVFTFVAASGPGYLGLAIPLLLAGAASASNNAASGRVVAGWFPRSRRGLAMGIRQMAQPLGVAIAALVVPPMAQHYGIAAPLILSGVVSAVVGIACAIGISNPTRPATQKEETRSPYAGDLFLTRIHALSALLVVPQFALATFGLIWLVSGAGLDTTVAGIVIAVAQGVGAVGRIAVGHVSDRMGSRVRVLRWVAVSGVLVMLLLAATGALHWTVPAAIALVVASTVSVADNGLAFTSVAEAAGPSWSGRALGIQNTGQFLVAALVGPGIGALITAVGYPVTFALIALTPLAAIPLVPAQDR